MYHMNAYEFCLRRNMGNRTMKSLTVSKYTSLYKINLNKSFAIKQFMKGGKSMLSKPLRKCK